MKSSHPGMFQSHKNATFFEKRKAAKLEKKLKKIMGTSHDPRLIKMMIDGCCDFLRKPVIEHTPSIETSYQDRRVFGKMLQDSVSPFREVYESNRLRKSNFEKAIKLADMYTCVGNLPLYVLIPKADVKDVYDLNDYAAAARFQSMRFKDKMHVIKLIERYVTAVLVWSHEREASNATARISSVEPSLT